VDANEELKHTWVLLHPDVYYDEANQMGCTGLITSADVTEDRFDVEVGQKNKLFASDHLMVLRDADDIYSDLLKDREQLTPSGLKDLYAIFLLRGSTNAEHYRRALEIASVNPEIRTYALVSLEDKLRLQTQQQLSVKHGR
jgi:hypothetical protein